jgi:hypothetical protein
MDERLRRIGENEALFRQINERVKEVSESFSLVLDTAEFVCECGDATCTERVAVGLADYERVRSNPTQFIVRPGHALPGVESIVEQTPGYDIVEKQAGEAARLAEETDPRG